MLWLPASTQMVLCTMPSMMASAWTPEPSRWCQSFLAYWVQNTVEAVSYRPLEQFQQHAAHALVGVVEKLFVDHEQGEGRVLVQVFGLSLWFVLRQGPGFLEVGHADVVGPDSVLAGLFGQSAPQVGLPGSGESLKQGRSAALRWTNTWPSLGRSLGITASDRPLPIHINLCQGISSRNYGLISEPTALGARAVDRGAQSPGDRIRGGDCLWRKLLNRGAGVLKLKR